MQGIFLLYMKALRKKCVDNSLYTCNIASNFESYLEKTFQTASQSDIVQERAGVKYWKSGGNIF